MMMVPWSSREGGVVDIIVIVDSLIAFTMPDTQVSKDTGTK